jgi:FtsH-binding integral membrane protein
MEVKMNQGFSPQNEGSYGQNVVRATPVAELGMEARLGFIRKTYVLFLAGILMSIVAGTMCLKVEPVFNAAISVLRTPILAIILLFGSTIAANAVSRVEGLNYFALFAFTALIGFLFAPIIAIYEMSQAGIVTQAAFLTIVVFGSLTAYAFISRKDFSYMGGILFVGLIALILGGLTARARSPKPSPTRLPTARQRLSAAAIRRLPSSKWNWPTR